MFSFLAAESVKITAKMVYGHEGRPVCYEHPLSHPVAELYQHVYMHVMAMSDHDRTWDPQQVFSDLANNLGPRVCHQERIVRIGEIPYRSSGFYGVELCLSEENKFLFKIHKQGAVRYIFEVNSFQDLESVFSSHKLVVKNELRSGLQLDISTIPAVLKPEEIKQTIDLFANTAINAPNNLPLECIVEQFISFAEQDGYIARHDRMKGQIVIGEKVIIRYEHGDNDKITSICVGTNLSYGLNLFNMKEVKNFFTTILGESK